MSPSDTPAATGVAAPLAARLAGPLAIVAATVAAYAHTFDAPFHLDDFGVIVQPDRLHDLANLWPPSGRRWVGDLTFALNYRLGGLAVGGYHAVNVAIHTATALLVAALAAATLRTQAASGGQASPLVRRFLPLAAGLLFAVHPLATQAVTYVVQRYASLATLLYTLALWLYLLARLAHLDAGRLTARAGALGAGAVLAAAAAMNTKEISLTLPIVAAGWEAVFLRFRGARRFPLLAPLAATALLPLLDPTVGQHLASEAPLSAWAYALTQTRVVVTYLRLLVLPVGQNLDHDVALSSSLGEPAVLGSLAVIVALLALGAFLVARGRSTGRVEPLLAGAGIGWFFVTLSVESSVIPLRDVIFEHRTYLPSVGAAMAFATALLVAVERRGLRAPPTVQVAAALAMVAGPLGVATWQRNQVWRDDVALWRDTVEKSPHKARPNQFLGTALSEAGDQDGAERELLAAIELEPGYLDAIFNLGNVYLAKGQLPQARVAFTLATQVAPGHAMSHNNLGAVYHRLGDLERAVASYQEALRLDPSLVMARRNLALLRQRMGGAGP